MPELDIAPSGTHTTVPGLAAPFAPDLWQWDFTATRLNLLWVRRNHCFQVGATWLCLV